MLSTSLSLIGMNVFVTAYSQSDFFGKLIFLGLIILSVVCWVVLLHKTWLTRKVREVSFAFQSAVEQNNEPLFSLDITDLPKTTSKIPHPFAAIFFSLKQKAVEVLNKNRYFSAQAGSPKTQAVYLSRGDLDLIESHVLTTISIQAKQLEKNLFILSTVVTLAPFLGLLGTVWGIVITFSELHVGSAGSSAMILGGLSTALAATVIGLLIAIPAIISYNYLKQTSKNLSSDMEDFLYMLLSRVELQYRKADID